MGRDYSRHGCVTCKRRKKKCDEGKPICVTCRRLSLSCLYRREESSQREAGVAPTDHPNNHPIHPTIIVKSLPAFRFQSEVEEAIMRRAEGMTATFLVPTCDVQFRDFSVLWQMMFDDDLVRNSIVACFSSVMSESAEYGRLHSRSYTRALQELRKRIASGPLIEKDVLAMQQATHFLASLDCISGELTDDPVRHWRGFASLLIDHGADGSSGSTSSRNVNLLAMEESLYNISCLALFTDDVDSTHNLLDRCRLLERLERMNPRGPYRITSSPILNGQYDLYELVLKVTSLHRRSASGPIPRMMIEALSFALKSHSRSFVDQFSTSSGNDASPEQKQALLEMHQSLADAISICLMALREQTQETSCQIHRQVVRMLDRLANFPEVKMCLDGLVWPLEILACSLQNDEELRELKELLATIEINLDRGHQSRLNAVVSQAQVVRAGAGTMDGHHQTSLFPAGLSLLKKPLSMV